MDKRHHVVTPYEGTGHREWDDAAAIEAPLRLHRTPVLPRWVDYNGHMSESCYLLVFGDNSDAFFRYVGIDEAYRAGGHSLFTVETHLHHVREAREGQQLELSLQLLDHDAKRLHLFHEMRRGEDDVVVAAAEQLLVHVDTMAGRSAPLPPEIHRHVAAVARCHAELPVPDLVGRPMGIRR